MKEICFQKNLKIMLDKTARVCHNFCAINGVLDSLPW
nr:MAG TPA: hypothetical protein [Caudoviricetes sp.]